MQKDENAIKKGKPLPLKVMTPELRRKQASRVLVFGPPGSWKTTSIISTAVYPLHILSFPGEMGWCTIPDNVPGLTSVVWEEGVGDPVTAESMRREVEDYVFKTIAGKNGPVKTLALDGLHKLYDLYINISSGGSFGRGEEFAAQAYGRSHQMFMSFLRKVLSSPIEYLIATTWSAREADSLGSKSSHEYPDVPGRLSKLLLGMFSISLYARVTLPAVPTGQAKGEWVLRPDTEVGGSHLKVDPRLATKLPARVPQNFKQLYALVGAAQAEVEKEEASAST